MNDFQTLRQTILEEVYSKYPFFAFLNVTTTLCRKVYVCYHIVKQISTFYKPPELRPKGNAAIYGAALHLFGQVHSVTSYAVKVLLITKCSQDILFQYHQLALSYTQFKQAFKPSYPCYLSTKTKRNFLKTKFFSPSSYLSLQIFFIEKKRKISRLIYCAADIAVQTFKLGMYWQDAALLLADDSHTRYRACSELCLSWGHYQEQLQQNGSYLLKEFAKKSVLTERILQRVASPYTQSAIVGVLQKTCLQMAQQCGDWVGKVQTVAKHMINPPSSKGKKTTRQLPPLPRQRFVPWTGQKRKRKWSSTLPKGAPAFSLFPEKKAGTPLNNLSSGLLRKIFHLCSYFR